MACARETREVDASTLSRKWRKKGRKVAKLPISRTHPEVAAQWHPDKNKGLDIDDITHGSHVKVWWLCEVHLSHQWEAAPHSRCSSDGEQNKGCPFCSGHRACSTNSLTSLSPQIASQWHFGKNKGLTPDTVTRGSNRRAWWQCETHKTHVWQTIIGSRTQDDTGCPFCSNKRACKTNSLAARFPELSAEWHKSKNGRLTAGEIVATSHKIVWWRCRKDGRHEWQTSPKSRTSEQTQCPFCVGRRTSQANNLAVRYPEIASEWHPQKNGALTPLSVVPGSHVSVWWRCNNNQKHTWATKIVNRTRNGSGCPVCFEAKRSTPRKRVSSAYNLAKLFPKLAEQWHPSFNGDLKPNAVAPGSNKVVWWQCQSGADHIWCTKVLTRAMRKTGCPCCSGRQVSMTNSLALQYPKVAAQWHPSRNGPLSPAEVTSGTKKQIWWQCTDNKRHIWQTTVRHRTLRGQGCPHCLGS